MARDQKINPYLAATDAQLQVAFACLKTRDDVAAMLEVSPKFLRWILYGKKERRHYTEKSLPKKHGGVRRICVPPLNLHILQDKLLRVLSLVYHPRACVTGFARGKCTLDNASPHIGKRFVVNLDLNDFFPSLHFGRIRGSLQSGPFSLGPEAALTIAQLATHDDGHLPQGAPTSPILANIVCGPFDTAMMEFARKYRFHYTRYADDITLSTTQRRLPEPVAGVDADGVCHLGPDLVALVSEYGFEIRGGKTRVRHSLRRQVATGLVLIEFPNVPRQFVRDLRALIHSCCVKGVPAASAVHSKKKNRVPRGDPSLWILNVIRGKLAYERMVRGKDDPVYRRLLQSANRISGAAFWQVVALGAQDGQPLRRRSRSSANWPLWIDRYRPCVFRLECRDPARRWDGFGTAFRVGKSCFVTAGHNVEYRPSPAEEPIRRELLLQLPLEHPTLISRLCATSGEWGAVDLALGHTILPECWPATVVPTQERLPQVGEEVAALGFPDIAARHVELVLHVGRIESVTRGYRDARFMTVSFSSGPALSGAPLLDANGYCLGVMVENTFLAKGDAPARPYGQAVAIGHWRELNGCGSRITTALDAISER